MFRQPQWVLMKSETRLSPDITWDLEQNLLVSASFGRRTTTYGADYLVATRKRQSFMNWYILRAVSFKSRLFYEEEFVMMETGELLWQNHNWLSLAVME
jgi:hypothetical protein